MSAMPVETPVGLPRGRALTRADLAAMPDDGHRYELLDGVLVVSPAPRVGHQVAVVNLYTLLRDAAEAPLRVLVVPVDVTLADDTVMQPDLVVAPRDAFTATELPEAPLLAVEVLSPSTRGLDLLLKKDRLERAGCAHYWVVDPEGPSITAWSLAESAYRQVAHAHGSERFEISDPFALTVSPTDLLR